MRCHLRKWYLRNGRFSPSSSKFVRPCGTPRFPFGFRQKISVRRNFLPEKRSESAGTDVRGIQKAKTATDVVHVRQGKELSGSPLFMPYPGMKPLFSPAVVKALLLPLHCICELFRLYPRQPVLPALSLVETACRNRRRDTNFSGYGGPFRKIHRTFVHRTNNNRITVKRTWLKLKSKIQK